MDQILSGNEMYGSWWAACLRPWTVGVTGGPYSIVGRGVELSLFHSGQPSCRTHRGRWNSSYRDKASGCAAYRSSVLTSRFRGAMASTSPYALKEGHVILWCLNRIRGAVCKTPYLNHMIYCCRAEPCIKTNGKG